MAVCGHYREPHRRGIPWADSEAAGRKVPVLHGPEFMKVDGPFQPPQVVEVALNECDPNVRKASSLATNAECDKNNTPNHFETIRLEGLSSWNRARRAVALCLRFKQRLINKLIQNGSQEAYTQLPTLEQPMTVAEMNAAEIEIFGSVQHEHFGAELKALQKLETRRTARVKNVSARNTSCLYRLDPFLDQHGLIRVGGRITKAYLLCNVRHPVILPHRSRVTSLLIQHVHQKVDHTGRGMTHNELRQKGYWVLGGSSAVSHHISKCVVCKRNRGTLEMQKMADFPPDRVEPAPPFTYLAVDYFGPFLIKEKRSELKRYGVIFTCMASRSIHIETANSFTTNSVIDALRRFLSRRGPVR